MNRNCNYPTESQLLLLKSIVFPPEVAILYWLEWKETFRIAPENAEQLLDKLDEPTRRFLPMAYANLQSIDDQWIIWIKGYSRHAWVRQQVLVQEFKRIKNVFDENGIELLVLKGLSMTITGPKTMKFRVMNDLDLYVSLFSRPQAIQLLNKLNYEIMPLDKAYMPLCHAGQFRNPAELEVDLHWHLFQEHLNPAMDGLFLNEVVDSESCQILSPTAQFFHLLYQSSHWDSMPNIRWVADCVLLARSENMDWDKIVSWTKILGFEAFVPHALEYLKKEFELAIPQIALHRLYALEINQYADSYFKLAAQPKTFNILRSLRRRWFESQAFRHTTSPNLATIFWWKIRGKYLYFWYRLRRRVLKKNSQNIDLQYSG